MLSTSTKSAPQIAQRVYEPLPACAFLILAGLYHSPSLPLHDAVHAHRATPAASHPSSSNNGLGLGLFHDVGAAGGASSAAALRAPWSFIVPPPPPSSSSSKISLGNLNSTGCMEQLLVHCANAIEANDATMTQQILWVLNNIAPPDGDSTQRLTAARLPLRSGDPRVPHRRVQGRRHGRRGGRRRRGARVAARAPVHPVELAGFVDLTPVAPVRVCRGERGHRGGVRGVPRGARGGARHHALHADPHPHRHAGHPARGPAHPAAHRRRLAGVLWRGGQHGAAAGARRVVRRAGARLVGFARWSRNVAMDFRVVPASPADAFANLNGPAPPAAADDHGLGRGSHSSSSEALV
ncbi:hypothetical protein PR202_ga29337 [Eleusine coracana subsp. coracana]|uniref:Uncharacterized protein n=1 Tax=Eleusine coracana subsp. coracana TaxID=191504 RepID=A0AAV5DLD0_ELECO|nr:hypothetical protein PR202_ga29337 [Eleusine coracana subsp. coracana]